MPRLESLLAGYGRIAPLAERIIEALGAAGGRLSDYSRRFAEVRR